MADTQENPRINRSFTPAAPFHFSYTPPHSADPRKPVDLQAEYGAKTITAAAPGAAHDLEVRLRACSRKMVSEFGVSSAQSQESTLPSGAWSIKAHDPHIEDMQGMNFKNIFAQAGSLAGYARLNEVSVTVGAAPSFPVSMTVADNRGDIAGDSFRRAVAYISLNGADIQSPGTLQIARVGDPDFRQDSAVDSTGRRAVKFMRACMQ